MLYIATCKCDIPSTIFISKGYSVRFMTNGSNSWSWTDVKDALSKDLGVDIPYCFLNTGNWEVTRIS